MFHEEVADSIARLVMCAYFLCLTMGTEIVRLSPNLVTAERSSFFLNGSLPLFGTTATMVNKGKKHTTSVVWALTLLADLPSSNFLTRSYAFRTIHGCGGVTLPPPPSSRSMEKPRSEARHYADPTWNTFDTCAASHVSLDSGKCLYFRGG